MQNKVEAKAREPQEHGDEADGLGDTRHARENDRLRAPGQAENPRWRVEKPYGCPFRVNPAPICTMHPYDSGRRFMHKLQLLDGRARQALGFWAVRERLSESPKV